MAKTKVKPCPVCMDDFTKIIRQPITCAYCPHAVCRQCISQFLLTSLNDPHCMECKREFNREYIDTNLTQTFRKGPLKLHRRKVLMDRERGRLPAMQVFVEATNTLNRLGLEVHQLKKDRRQLKIQRNELLAQTNLSYDVLSQQLEPIHKRLSEKKLMIRTLETQMATARAVLTGKEKAETRQFIMKCPAEECRGFLSSAWKCGTCDKFFCSECHAQKAGMRDEAHTCNEEAKATASMIRQETKPCPKCGIRISKIDGCDQMWCTECHTTFSWNSGQVLLNTVVHNPHYYEYLRKANGGAVPREAGDIPCGGLPNPYLFSRLIYEIDPQGTKFSTQKKYEVTQIHRCLSDIFNYRLPNYPLRQNANVNRDIDILYLMNRMTEDEWATKLEHIETQFERKKEIGLILQTLVHIGSEKLTALQNHLQQRITLDQKIAEINRATAEMVDVRTYINNSLLEKGIQMGIVVPQISDYWMFSWASRDQIRDLKQKKKGGNQTIEVEEEIQNPNPIITPVQAVVEQEQIHAHEEPVPEVEEDDKRVVVVEIDGEMMEMTYAQALEMMMSQRQG